jgi:hypothetical protein
MPLTILARRSLPPVSRGSMPSTVTVVLLTERLVMKLITPPIASVP